MTKPLQTSRRDFLKTTAAGAAAFAVPMYIPSTVWGANERINTGHIGLGGQGRGNLGGFINNAIAVCDVDQKHLAAGAKMLEDKGKTPLTFGDYRKLLEREDIDAVVITTPDHWHALQTIHACQAGKDVYVEKPLTLTIGEGRKMVEVARATERIVQTGSQQRSDKLFRQACEMVRNGRIGDITEVRVGIPAPNHPGEPVPDSNPPAELDYDLWLGPAPQKPYNVKHVHYNFRFFRDYSGGQMTNWGAHHLDIAQWGLGMDDSGPVEVEGTGTFHPKKWHEVTESCLITYTYANGVKLILGQKQEGFPGGTMFIGTKGKIFVTRGQINSDPKELLAVPIGENDIRLYSSNNHKQDFLNCIASRKLPICDVEIGHRTATLCHLGNMAVELGEKLTWDPVSETFSGNDKANGLIHKEYRKPWSLES